MKRSVLLLLISGVMLLAACAEPTVSMPGLYRSDISVTGGELDFEGGLIRSDECLSLTVTSPSAVSGLTFEYYPGETRMSMSGLLRISDDNGMPGGSAPELISEVFDNIASAEFTSSAEGEDSFIIPLENERAVLTCRNGSPTRLNFENSPYIITFYNSDLELLSQ